MKKLLLVSIFILLFLPLIQSIFHFKEIKPLKGDVSVAESIELNKKDWFLGSFQEKKEKYLNEFFGFRNVFVRLNNQIAYSFFKKAKANGVIIGKNNYLYEENYIKAALGKDYVGSEIIKTNVDRLKKVQDYLGSLNKDIVFVLAPGKGTFFPEYFPAPYSSITPEKTNYEAYLESFQKNGINYLDFNKWFRDNKSKTEYPLYSKCGIHWSKYSELLVADSIIKYFENKRNIHLPHIIIDSIEKNTINQFEDYDIGDGMNLLFDLPTYPMGYPKYHINFDNNPDKLKSLVVADSYYWGMYNYGISRDIFSEGSFWYYNKQIYSNNLETPLDVTKTNIQKEIENHDVFILLFTDANLYNFDYGFTDLVYNSIFGLTDTVFIGRVNYYIDKIKKTPEWLENIKKQALDKNQTIDQTIKENAEYMVKTEG